MLGLLAVLSVHGTSTPSERRTAEKLERLRTQISDVERRVGDTVTERDAAARQLRTTELEVTRAHRQLDALRDQRRAAEERRNAIEAERHTYEHTLDREGAALSAQLRAAYLIGREEPLKLLLNQQDPATLGRMLAYYSYFGRARADQIALIRTAVTKLDSLELELDEQNRHLDELASERQREVDALEGARTQRAAALVAVREQLQSRSAKLDDLKRQATTLTKLLEELRRALREFPIDRQDAFDKLRGQLAWPVQGKVLADFGDSRSSGINWTGVLFGTDRGTQVRALYYGRVIYADWLPGLGLLLILEHSGGYLSLYGHTEQIFKSVGDWVAPGDVIATVGDSGGEARPELYFEMRKGSKPINPHPWFKQKLGAR
ncbi:MAG TPA: peptidoglycan DD-metalloendopeptidase family protein [Steroidobacteraceae bacterium]|nr:peptidoglycan DD-metalloendopeptidase family protein [Steroidobacteraceae bacterium]